jgi:broad specificity phosphatase PhoE
VRLFLIRHGQTPHNVEGALDTGYPGAGLTPLGHAQARAVPAALGDQRIAGVYASRLVRTQLTAAPLAGSLGLDVTVLAGLEEISAGDLEMRSDAEAVQAYVGCAASWMRGDLDLGMPGGTTGREFHRRYDAAVRGIAARHAPDDGVAVFSHGAAIRVFTALACGLAPDVAAQLRLMNTGMSVLEGDPGSGWDLVRWSTEPLGGVDLEDVDAHDVTGENAEDARHEA